MAFDIDLLVLGDYIDPNTLATTKLNSCAAESDGGGWCSLTSGPAGQHAQTNVAGLVHFAWGDPDRDEEDAVLTDEEEAAIRQLIGAYEEIDSAIDSAYWLVSELQQKFKQDTPLGKIVDDLWVRHDAADILEVPGEFFEGDETEWAKFLHG